MSITINTNTYVGKFAQEYIAPALLGGKTLGGNHLTIKANVKNSLRLTIASTSTNLIQAYACSFNAQGTVTLGERYLTPVLLKVNWENCKKDLVNTWASEQMVAGANNTDNTKLFNDFLIERVQTEVASEVDEIIWLGKIAGSGGIYATKPYLKFQDGFFTKAVADANTIKISSPLTISSSNVIQELTRVYNAIPDTIFDLVDSLKFFVSRDVYRAYGIAQDAFFSANSNYQVNNKMNYDFRGIQLIPVSMGTSHMFVGDKRNLFFATDLEGDLQTYQMLDLSKTTGDDLIRIIMEFSLDVNYGNSSEIVSYGV